MFSDINAESTRRLTEAKSLVLLIKNEDLIRSLNLDSKVHKGAFFVLLYGALEYTITAVVQRCISILNKRQYDIHHVPAPASSQKFLYAAKSFPPQKKRD